VSAHEAMTALARDLVTELASGMALELAAQAPGQPPAAPATPAMVPPPKTGAAAVYPQLGVSLVVPPGDTISGLAYAYLQPPPPPGAQPGARPPIAGQ
jgi:hypothetical protein